MIDARPAITFSTLVGAINSGLVESSLYRVAVGPLTVWIRFPSYRVCKGERLRAIEIPNVHVKAEHCRQGHLARFLDRLEELGFPVYVDGVVNGILADYLERRGYENPRSGARHEFFHGSFFLVPSSETP